MWAGLAAAVVASAAVAAVLATGSGSAGGSGLNPTRVQVVLQNASGAAQNGQTIQWNCAQGGSNTGFQGMTCYADMGIDLTLAGAPDSQPIYDISDDGSGCFTASVENTSDADYADMYYTMNECS